MNRGDAGTLAERWRLMWNGELQHRPTTIAPDFVAHAAPLTGGAESVVDGADALDDWIRGIHGILDASSSP